MDEIMRRFDDGLRGFADELGSVIQSILAWLKNDTTATAVRSADRRATEHTCKAMKDSVKLVLGYLEIIRNPGDHDYDSLQAVVDELNERQYERDAAMDGEARDPVSVEQSLRDLLEVMQNASGVIEGILEAGVANLLELTWFEDTDTNTVREDFELHSREIREQFDLLRLLVIDLIDPKYQDLMPVVARMEDDVKELKSRMASAVRR